MADNTEKREKRRIKIDPNKKREEEKINLDDVTIIPNISHLMGDALAIIGNELTRYRSKTKRGVTLDLKEARAVQGYMETLVKMSRESREQARSEDLSQLSDEELHQLALEVIKKDSKKKIEE